MTHFHRILTGTTRTHRRFGFACVAAVAALSAVVVSSVHASPPSDWIESIWVAESGGFTRIKSSDGSILFEDGSAKDMRALAIDEVRATVVGYGPQSRLRFFAFDGTVLADVTVAVPDNFGMKIGGVPVPPDVAIPDEISTTFRDHVSMDVDTRTGDLWLGVGDAVFQYDENGTLITSFTVPGGYVTGIGIDEQTATHRLFVGTETRAIRYDTTGSTSIALPGVLASVLTLQEDPTGSDVWLSTSEALLRFDGGTLSQTLSVSVPGIRHLALDSVGGAWAAVNLGVASELLRIDDLGNVIYEIAPFTSSERVVSLQCDFGDLSAWLASRALLKHFADGAVTEDTPVLLDPAMRIRSLGVFADHTAPSLAGAISSAIVSPSTDPTGLPVFGFTYSDSQTGIDAPSFSASLSPSTALSCSTSSTNASCIPVAFLADGSYSISATVSDLSGNPTFTAFSFSVDGPEAVPDPAVSMTVTWASGVVTVTGASGSVEPYAFVRLRNKRTNEVVVVRADASGAWSATLAGWRMDEIEVTAFNRAGDAGSTDVLVPMPPGEPSAYATVIDPSVPTDLAQSVRFLFEGSNRFQVITNAAVIENRRLVVLRGSVKDASGAALAGVKVELKDRGECGYTFTRETTGKWDLVCNGGGTLVARLSKSGYLTVDRVVEKSPWRDFVTVDAVVLTAIDTAYTDVTFGASAPAQTHIASSETDGDGTRNAVIFIPASTSATMEFEDGSTEALSGGRLRASEFTLGTNLEATIPGPLPPRIGQTYAAEYSIDEAIDTGATSVTFSQPIVGFVKNIVGLPVGTVVPAAVYDRVAGAWVGIDAGLVIKLLSVTGTSGNLDLVGDGNAADATALAAAGISDDERAAIASSFSVSDEIFRTAVPHFSPVDTNMPVEIADRFSVEGAVAPDVRPGPTPPDETCQVAGSIVGCEDRSLGEVIPITGAGLALRYDSTHVRGRKPGVQNLVLTPSTIPASLDKVLVEIDIAGQEIRESLSPAPSMTYSFSWDGRDAYGRALQGAALAHIRIGYSYPAEYAQSVSGQWDAPPGPVFPAIIGARQDLISWQEFDILVGQWNNESYGLGGWNLTGHHGYDPTARSVSYSNGNRRSEVGPQMEVVAGQGVAGANFSLMDKLKVHPDGSLYIADGMSIRRLRTDGTVDVVAGQLTLSGFSGDGGSATAAKLNGPAAVAFAPDGSWFIADSGNGRIRKVSPTGVISTFAGNGGAGTSGDGGPATSASIGTNLNDVEVGPDGSVYIVSTSQGRIRRVLPGGTITTFAGGGATLGDGGAATSAKLLFPRGIAIGGDGDIFIADSQQFRIRRVKRDGTIKTIAGTGTSGHTGDGGPASLARIKSVSSIARKADGTLFLAQQDGRTIRRIEPSGVITTLAGTISDGTCSPATGASVNSTLGLPWGLDVAPDGAVYFTDIDTCSAVLRIGNPMRGFGSADENPIPSQDGASVDVFAGNGRHLRTLDALTGALQVEFSYDSVGRLSSAQDAYGNTVSIGRSGSGAPTSITAPGGQFTDLTVDAHGYLASVENPAGDTYTLSHTANGLLETFTTPNGEDHTFTWSSAGLLVRDSDPASGWKELASSATIPGKSSITSRLGREKEFVLSGDAAMSSETITFSDGTSSSRTTLLGTTTESVFPDGTEVISTRGYDPRFGTRGSFVAERLTMTPAGLNQTVEHVRTQTYAVSGDPTTRLTSQTDDFTVNGNLWSTNFASPIAGSSTVTSTSPEGRQSIATLDAQGRVVQAQAGDLAPVDLTYDSRGRLTRVRQVSGSETREATLAWDSANRLNSVTDPLGRTTYLDYDAALRPVEADLPGGRTLSLAYNEDGAVTGVTPPGKPEHAFGYDEIDQQTLYTPPTVTSAGSLSTSTAYDFDHDPTLVTRPDGGEVTLTWDSAGRLSEITFPGGGSITPAWDGSTGQLVSLTTASNDALAFTWDGPLPLSEEWTGAIAGSVSRTFDGDFRVITEKVNGGSSVTVGYDSDGLVTGVGSETLTRDAETGLLNGTTLGSITTSRTYSGFGELASESASDGTTTLYSASYTRDLLGRIATREETIGGVTVDFVYSYDSAGRLSEVTRDGNTLSEHTFDLNGNRLTHVTSAGTISATYDDQDRMLTYGSTDFTYTANGELLTKTDGSDTTSYEYDALGNLRSVELPNGDDLVYLIDARNRRIGKQVNGTLVQGFLYRDQLEPVAEFDGSGNVVSRFVYASKAHVPDYMVKSGVTYRIVSDHLGSPRLVINTATGAIAQRMDFDEWGNVTLDTAPGFQPFGFAGGLLDLDTGLTRFGARDYSAETGRWTAKDPAGLGAGLNLYAYGFGDPVNRIDATGRAPKWVNWYAWSTLALYPPAQPVLLEKLWDDLVTDQREMQERVFPYDLGGLPKERIDRCRSKFRHCTASCTGSVEYGSFAADFLGAVREPDYFLDNDPDGNDSFDLNANRVGRDVAEGLNDRNQCLGPCSEFGFKFP